VIRRAHLGNGRAGAICIGADHVLRLRNSITRTGKAWQSNKAGLARVRDREPDPEVEALVAVGAFSSDVVAVPPVDHARQAEQRAAHLRRPDPSGSPDGHALELLAGVRPEEAAALRWRHYDPAVASQLIRDQIVDSISASSVESTSGREVTTTIVA